MCKGPRPKVTNLKGSKCMWRVSLADAVQLRWRRLASRLLFKLRRRLVASFAGAFRAYWRDRGRLGQIQAEAAKSHGHRPLKEIPFQGLNRKKGLTKKVSCIPSHCFRYSSRGSKHKLYSRSVFAKAGSQVGNFTSCSSSVFGQSVISLPARQCVFARREFGDFRRTWSQLCSISRYIYI